MTRPNILLITSDQHRADSLGVYDHPCIQTPHIDQLAYEGIRFDNAYTDCPVCIPARTTLITGIQSHHYGSPSYNPSFRINRDRSAFLGGLLTQAGYQTGLVGKQHWHTPHYFKAGFESVVPLAKIRKQRLSAKWEPFVHEHAGTGGIGFNELTPDMSLGPPELQQSTLIVNECLDFLTYRDVDQPFFLWASFQDPHPPLMIHEPYYSMYDDDAIPLPLMGSWAQRDVSPVTHYVQQMTMKTHLMSQRQIRKARSVYYGMITHLDNQLARLFGKLMSEDVWDNTLVIYTTDHGEFLGDHGAGRKNSFCEASARLPFIIRPPAKWQLPPGRSSAALVQLADILPTLCEVAGSPALDDIDGKSLMDIVTGQSDSVRKTLHGNIDNTHMFHDGNYKYMYYVDDGAELLFDVRVDRNDMLPVIGPKVDQMRVALMDHLKAEGHPHMTGGNLLNRHLVRPSEKQALSNDGAALGPLDGNTFAAKHTLHLDLEGPFIPTDD